MNRHLLLLSLLSIMTFFSTQVQNGLAGQPLSPCGRDGEQVFIPAGNFTMGSSREEREFAYRLDNEITRAYGWYERETQSIATTAAFCIHRYPVTNAEYLAFISETDHAIPYISSGDYHRQGFLVHPYTKVKEFLWTNQKYPKGRENHPVVLISVNDAKSYCSWRGRKVGRRYRLPSEVEWEKAARGTDGRYFPWGNQWNPSYLNSGNRFGGTTAVGRFAAARSPYGVEELSGNTFEWTATPWDDRSFVVKGCSWDDAPGTCRAAMRHGRPAPSKHILIGFRCASDLTGLDLRWDAG